MKLFLAAYLLLNIATADQIPESTVILLNENNSIVSYGVMISSTSMFVPKKAYEKFNEVTKFEYLDIFYNSVIRPDLIEKKSLPMQLPAGTFKQLTNATYIFESNGFQNINENRTLKIRQYPICETDKNLKTITLDFYFSTTRETLASSLTTNTELYSSEKCKKYFNNFDEKTQVCGPGSAIPSKKWFPGIFATPLVATINNEDYVVGLSDEDKISGIALFNVIGEPCLQVPKYQKCNDQLLHHCNEIEVSKDLIKLFHDRIVLTQNGNQFGLGVAASYCELLVFCDENDSLDDLVIYSNGEMYTKVGYLDHVIIDSDIRMSSGKAVKLLKLSVSLFYPAMFYFDETINGTNFDTLQFIDEKLVRQKTQNETKNL